MPKKVISVGFEFPGNAAEYIPFNSDRSLLDADIIVFQPAMRSQYSAYDSYKGKPLFDEHDSFKAVEDASHWLSELKNAFDAGKTIIIYLSKLEEFHVHTGRKEYSGTGRNRAVTNIVNPMNNYSCLPFSFKRVVSSSGKEIKAAKELKFLVPYWKNFAEHSSFEVYLEGEFKDIVFTTRTGNKAVGIVISGLKGTMILLPPLQYNEEEFVKYNKRSDSEVWTPKAIAFGKSLLSHIVEIDNVLTSNKDATPAPDWTKQEGYRIASENVIEQEIKSVNTNIEELQNTRSKLNIQLEDEGKLRWLLYEKGHLLEDVILEALRLMGFKADNYKDSESEFDAVFTSPEGRFLGETEGKDNTAINIDKLSQLERNIQEDFARDDIKKYAHGVLFGNAYRLSTLQERAEFFTEKCISGAKRAGIALVCTPDLFFVAKYLKEHNDLDYARQCREAIFEAIGKKVSFPPIPEIITTIIEVESDNS